MALFKSRPDDAPAEVGQTGPVSREEFDQLRGELNAFRRIAAIGYMCSEEAARYPGVSGGIGSARQRLEKIALVASEHFGLAPADVRELCGFLRLVEQARDGEYQRETAEVRARANLHEHPWRADGTFSRNIV